MSHPDETQVLIAKARSVIAHTDMEHKLLIALERDHAIVELVTEMLCDEVLPDDEECPHVHCCDQIREIILHPINPPAEQPPMHTFTQEEPINDRACDICGLGEASHPPEQPPRSETPAVAKCDEIGEAQEGHCDVRLADGFLCRVAQARHQYQDKNHAFHAAKSPAAQPKPSPDRSEKQKQLTQAIALWQWNEINTAEFASVLIEIFAPRS